MSTKDCIQARKLQAFKPNILLRPHTYFHQRKQMRLEEALTTLGRPI